MDDDQELLLTDSLRNSPRNSRILSEQQEILLVDSDKAQLKLSDIKISLPVKPPHLLQKVNLKLKSIQFDNLRFLQDQESSQQDQSDQIVSFQRINQLTKGKNSSSSSFDYYNLTVKLQMALQRIKAKIDSKVELRFQSETERTSIQTSRAIKRMSSPSQKRRKFNQQGILTDRIKSRSMMKTCITQPDENENLARIHHRRKNVQKYNTDRIISQEVEKENDCSFKARRREKLRTKQGFLASMATWQEKKARKQKERVEKEKVLSMAGVTFAPQINAKSKELMRKKGNMLPIYQRQIRHLKPQHDQNVKKGLSNKGKK